MYRPITGMPLSGRLGEMVIRIIDQIEWCTDAVLLLTSEPPPVLRYAVCTVAIEAYTVIQARRILKHWTDVGRE